MNVGVINLLRLGDLIQSLPLIEQLSKSGSVTFFTTKLNVGSFIEGLVDCKVVELDIDCLIRESRILNYNSFYSHFDDSLLGTFDYVINLNSFELSYYIASFYSDNIVGVKYEERKVVKDRQFFLLFDSSNNRKKAPINLSQLYLSYTDQVINEAKPERSDAIHNIVININTGSELRNFPPCFYIDLINKLEKRYKVTLVGTDNLIGETIYHRFKSSDSVTNLVGMQSIDQLYQLLTNSDLLISPDTATIHLGARAGVPILGLYNISAFYYQTAPFSDAVLYVPDRECYPCNEDFQPCGNLACMSDYSGGEVAEIVGNYFDLTPSKRIIVQKRSSDGTLIYLGGDQKMNNLSYLLSYIFTGSKSSLSHIVEIEKRWSWLKKVSINGNLSELKSILDTVEDLNYLSNYIFD